MRDHRKLPTAGAGSRDSKCTISLRCLEPEQRPGRRALRTTLKPAPVGFSSELQASTAKHETGIQHGTGLVISAEMWKPSRPVSCVVSGCLHVSETSGGTPIFLLAARQRRSSCNQLLTSATGHVLSGSRKVKALAAICHLQLNCFASGRHVRPRAAAALLSSPRGTGLDFHVRHP